MKIAIPVVKMGLLMVGASFAAGFAGAAEVARIGTTTYTSLVEAITASQADDVIELLDDVEESFADASQTSKAPIAHNLTITSADGARRTVKATNTKGYSFYVTSGTLTLSNVVFTSVSRDTGSYDMYLFAYGSSSKVVFGEDFLLRGVTNTGGHAVCYFNYATLDMRPGAEVQALCANYGHLRFNQGTFNMSGGIVRDCHGNQQEGSPVYLYGRSTLNMSGGTITGCSSHNPAYCGAVFAHADGPNYVNLSGGAITNNAVYGVYADATAAAKIATIAFSGDAVVKDNAMGDVFVKRDDEVTLGGAFTGYATVTNGAVAGLPTAGTKVGANASGYYGAENLRCAGAGHEDWQLLTVPGGNLVWSKQPVRLNGTLYRSLHAAFDAAPDAATFEILCDFPEFRDPVVRTNATWRFEGVGGPKTLAWPTAYLPFAFYQSDVTFSNVVLTATENVGANTFSDMPNQYFFNLACGRLTFEAGSGITNVWINKHAVIGLAHDPIRGDNDATSASTLTMKPGSVVADCTSNYGAVRFETWNSSFVMEGGLVTNCTSRQGEGSPVYFLCGGNMTMTGGALAGNATASTRAATVWLNNGGDFTFDFLGGTIAGNSNPVDFANSNTNDSARKIAVNLGGNATFGAPGVQIHRAKSGSGSMTVNCADDWTGTAAFTAADGLLADPAATRVLGLGSAAAAARVTWANAAAFPAYAFRSLSNLLVLAPAGATTAETAFGDYSTWHAVNGLATDLSATLAAARNNSALYLLKDVTITEPLGDRYASYVLDGRGCTIACANTNLLATAYAAVTLKNMTVTGARGRSSVVGSGVLTFGAGFTFRDFAGLHPYSYASFVADGTGQIVMEDGAVIEDGRSQVGVVRVEGSDAKFTMNGGVIRNLALDPISNYKNEGAAVQVIGGTFEMNGGVISNCLWDASAARPDFRSAVYLNTSTIYAARTFRMTGGRIVGNTAGVWSTSDANNAVEISGTAVIATNDVSDLELPDAAMLRQTGDFAGDVVVTAPFGARGTAFGVHVAGTGAECFRHGSKWGRADGGVLKWDSDRNGLNIILR